MLFVLSIINNHFILFVIGIVGRVGGLSLQLANAWVLFHRFNGVPTNGFLSGKKVDENTTTTSRLLVT